MSESVSDKAERLFATDPGRLIAFGEESWRMEDLSTTDMAEMARFVRVQAYAEGLADAELWQARALSSAAISGNLRSLALSLQVHVFKLVEVEEFGSAREVLDLMIRLIETPQDSETPEPDLCHRIHAERMAFTYLCEEEWEKARQWYEIAVGFSAEESRGALKVEGGLALVVWMSGGDTHTAALAFEAIAKRAADYPDVREAALANYRAAKLENKSAAVPFERT